MVVEVRDLISQAVEPTRTEAPDWKPAPVMVKRAPVEAAVAGEVLEMAGVTMIVLVIAASN